MSRTIRNFYEFVLKDLTSQKFQSILDIGSGRGTVLVRLAEAMPDVEATGIDPSSQMIKLSRRKATKRNLGSRLKFTEGSSRNIPGDQKYDLIISTISFHHWKEKKKSINTIMNHLSSNGRFIVYELYMDGGLTKKMVKSHLLSRKDVETVSSETGFPVRVHEENGFIKAEFINS